MSRIIDRGEVMRMVAREAVQLVEVLPRDDYEFEHIVGAVSLPLGELTRESARNLDPDRPLIVYCNDFL